MRSIFSILKKKLKKYDSISIVICTEKGELEKYSCLLVKSIRKFGGRYKDCPIHSYQPRMGFQVSENTLQTFEEYGVNHHSIPLNIEFPDYPLANKPLVCAYAEKNLKTELILFLDSDIVILNEPNDFNLSSDFSVKLRPVDSKNIGAYGAEDVNYEYWKNIYKICNATITDQYVYSTVDNKKIIPYFNSGHILSKRKNHLFLRWKENFEKVMRTKLRPDHGIFFVEQSVLAATVVSLGLTVEYFKNEYNYPVHMQGRKMPLFNKIASVEHVTTMHYHKMFNQDLNPAQHSFFSHSKKGSWLFKTLNELKF